MLQHEGTMNVKYKMEQLIHPKYFFHSYIRFFIIFFQLFAQDLVVLAFCVSKVFLKAQIVSIGMSVVLR